MQVSRTLSVSFHDSELFLVDHDGQPLVPMKPVVEGMGLAWQTQHRKLVTGRFASTITEMVIVAEDGKHRQMTCLPLRKLNGWFMSIHPNKVKPELRECIIAYQNECDDALWAYWNDQRSSAVQATPAPAQPAPTLPPLNEQRWITTYDSKGSQHTHLLPTEKCIMSAPEFIQHIADQNGMHISTIDLLDFITKMMLKVQAQNSSVRATQ